MNIFGGGKVTLGDLNLSQFTELMKSKALMSRCVTALTVEPIW